MNKWLPNFQICREISLNETKCVLHFAPKVTLVLNRIGYIWSSFLAEKFRLWPWWYVWQSSLRMCCRSQSHAVANNDDYSRRSQMAKVLTSFEFASWDVFALRRFQNRDNNLVLHKAMHYNTQNESIDVCYIYCGRLPSLKLRWLWIPIANIE